MAKLTLGGHLPSCSRFFENEPGEICRPFEFKKGFAPDNSKITLV